MQHFGSPFFFVEAGLIKVFYLQPRKNAGLEFDELCMVATIMKRFPLDTGFMGNAAMLSLLMWACQLVANCECLRDIHSMHSRCGGMIDLLTA